MNEDPNILKFFNIANYFLTLLGFASPEAGRQNLGHFAARLEQPERRRRRQHPPSHAAGADPLRAVRGIGSKEANEKMN